MATTLLRVGGTGLGGKLPHSTTVPLLRNASAWCEPAEMATMSSNPAGTAVPPSPTTVAGDGKVRTGAGRVARVAVALVTAPPQLVTTTSYPPASEASTS